MIEIQFDWNTIDWNTIAQNTIDQNTIDWNTFDKNAIDFGIIDLTILNDCVNILINYKYVKFLQSHPPITETFRSYFEI